MSDVPQVKPFRRPWLAVVVVASVLSVAVASISGIAIARLGRHSTHQDKVVNSLAAALTTTRDQVSSLGKQPVAPSAQQIIAQPGPAGAAGAQGPKGDRGDTGAQGPAGRDAPCITTPTTAPPGGVCSGAVGTAGVSGAAGGQGATGLTGSTGATGPTGATGNTGATGATGPAGAAGPPGAQGQPGPAGAQGASGPPPSSFTWTDPNSGVTYRCTQSPAGSTSYSCSPQTTTTTMAPLLGRRG